MSRSNVPQFHTLEFMFCTWQIIRLAMIEECLRLAGARATLNDSIKSRALALERGSFKALDALHVACAEAGRRGEIPDL